jgi:DNA-binding Lrp family transcriptional regulator
MAAKRPPALDRIDIKILAALQRDGRMSIAKLSKLVGLSPRPCLERVRRLRGAGIIVGYQAVLNVDRLSRPVTVFAAISLVTHRRQDRLERRLAQIDEAVECWQVSGDVDYFVRFVCADLSAYEALTNDLVEDDTLGIARLESHIALRPVRRFEGYPVSLLKQKNP